MKFHYHKTIFAVFIVATLSLLLFTPRASSGEPSQVRFSGLVTVANRSSITLTDKKTQISTTFTLTEATQVLRDRVATTIDEVHIGELALVMGAKVDGVLRADSVNLKQSR